MPEPQKGPCPACDGKGKYRIFVCDNCGNHPIVSFPDGTKPERPLVFRCYTCKKDFTLDQFKKQMVGDVTECLYCGGTGEAYQ
jgi:DNA-directed RNA polymerase subunit RPC12/RpoP